VDIDPEKLREMVRQVVREELAPIFRALEEWTAIGRDLLPKAKIAKLVRRGR